LTSLIAAADLRYSERFQAQEKAILKAESASEKRFDGVNEFRGALSDMVGKLMPRAESEQRYMALSVESEQRYVTLSEKLDLLRQRIDKHEATGGGLRMGWGYLAGSIATLVGVFTLLTLVAGHIRL